MGYEEISKILDEVFKEDTSRFSDYGKGSLVRAFEIGFKRGQESVEFDDGFDCE